MSVAALNRILAKEDKENNQSLLYLLQTLGAKRLFEANEFNDIRDALGYLDSKPSGGGAVDSVTGNIVSGTATDPVITQVQPDWNAVSGLGQILNKPTLSADQFQVIKWDGYLQFTQAPTTWYNKNSQIQGGSWLTAPWNVGIGSSPTNIDASSNSERLLQNCYLDKAFIYLHNTNGARTLNIKWYKYNRTQGSLTATNVVEICNISKTIPNIPNQAFVLNTDFTINNANLNEGDFITFVINQTDNASGVATNWSMYLIFKKR